MRMSGFTLSSSVASMIVPLRFPPAISVAPSATASAISASIFSADARLMRAPP
jgi:hypothetical protein